MKEDPKIPTNQEAERSLLGAMLINQDNAMRAFSVMNGEEFFLEPHRLIFRAMQGLAGESSPIDMVSVSSALSRSKQLGRALGPAYIASLVDGVPRVCNVEHYAKLVGDAHKLRNILHFTEDIRKLVADKEGDVDEIVEVAVRKILDISTSGHGGPIVRSWAQVTDSAVHKIQEEHDTPEKSARINTGLEEVDNATNGLRKKELVLIVGRTSSGKTLLAAQIADYAESQGYRGIFFSGEMPGEQVVIRQLAYEAGFDFWKTRFPEKLNDAEIDALREVAKRERNVLIVENDISPMNIWALCETQKRTHGLDFVIVDYDQLVIEAGINADEDEDSFFRHQRKFMLQAQKMVGRLDICFILLSQLRKLSHNVAKGGKPGIDDIYGDSSIRNTPHVILWVVRDFFLHDLKPEFERKASVYIIKARNGRTTKIDLTFDQNRVRLLDKEPSEEDSVEEKKPSKNVAFVIEDGAPF